MKDGYEYWATYNEAELQRDFIEEHREEFTRYCRENYKLFKKIVGDLH